MGQSGFPVLDLLTYRAYIYSNMQRIIIITKQYFVKYFTHHARYFYYVTLNDPSSVSRFFKYHIDEIHFEFHAMCVPMAIDSGMPMLFIE